MGNVCGMYQLHHIVHGPEVISLISISMCYQINLELWYFENLCNLCMFLLRYREISNKASIFLLVDIRTLLL